MCDYNKMSNLNLDYYQSTGVIYEDSMTKHYCLWDPIYPECPERYLEILKRCEELNLLSRCKKLTARKATHDELRRKHSEKVIELLKEIENKSEAELEQISSRFDSIYICSETYNAALLSAGCTLSLIQAICNDEIRNGMAIVRPPGHHAMESEYCGYCFFNNVAIAADYALEKFDLSRILIVDWDVHHGQATQQMFYEDPRVLYFSIHRYENGTFWPNLKESNCDYIGEASGKGYNFNVPLNKTGFGNAEYLAIFHHLLLPIAVEYQPQLIIVSAGYDAAVGCPEGEMKVTPACYAHFLNSLKILASGKIAVVLEGGYCLESLSEGAALTLRALLDDPCPDIGAVKIHQSDSIRETIFNVINQHRPFWKCFQIYDTYAPSTLHSETNAFIPVIKYEFEETRPDRFQTRDCYPPINKDTKIKYATLIGNLIQETDLNVPQFRSIFLSSWQNDFQQIHKLFEYSKGKIMEVDKNCSVQENILKAINYLLNNSTRSVILDKVALTAKQNNFNVEDFVLNNTVSSKSVLLINFHAKINLPEKTVNNSDNFLHFSFIHENFSNYESGVGYNYQDNNIEMVWNEETVSDYDYITAWLKIILPLSYQFHPGIIICVVNFQYQKNTSPELYGFLIHWLTSLSNGKIIFLVDCDVNSDFTMLSFVSCCKALLGYPLPSLKINSTSCSKTLNILKNVNRILVEKWSHLNFFLKLPHEM